MKLVTVHLPDLHVKQIAEMVHEGKYVNRSELIREAVGKFLAKEKEEQDKVIEG